MTMKLYIVAFAVYSHTQRCLHAEERNTILLLFKEIQIDRTQTQYNIGPHYRKVLCIFELTLRKLDSRRLRLSYSFSIDTYSVIYRDEFQ